MEKDKRVEWADVCRGIGIIYVIIGHVFYNNVTNRWFISFHMPLFVFLSGLFFSYNNKNIKGVVISKMKSLILPYYVFGLISLIYYWVIEIRFRNMNMSIGDSILGNLICYIPLMNNAPLWYLPCFFLIAVSYYIMRKKLSPSKILVVGGVLNLLYWLLNLNKYLYSFPLEIPRVLDLFVYYALGAWLRDVKKPYPKVTEWGLSSKVMYVIVINIISIEAAYLLHFKLSIIHIPLAILGINATVAIAIFLKHSKILQNIGRNSLFILCTHVPVYRLLLGATSLIIKCSSDYIRETWYFAFPIVLGTLIICLSMNCFINCLKDKFVNRMV